MRALGLLLALVLVGCEDEVAPTVGLDVPFSMYGYLDPTADRQALRVVAIVGDLEATDDPVRAAVTITDLEAGTTTAWRDSAVTFSDGTTGIVHVVDFTPRPGATYRVEAVAADGSASRADVRVPPIVPATVGAPAVRPGEVTYTVRFEGAPRVLGGQLRLTVSDLPGAPETETRVLTATVGVQPREVEPDVWAADVPFVTAARRALEAERLAGAGVRLLSADYVGFVANEQWDAPTDDPDALAEPGVFSNVEGGLGFVGAGYRATARWVPDPAVQAAAGFDPGGDIASFVALNEVSVEDDWVELYNPLFTDVSLAGYSLSDDQAQPRRQVLPFGTVVPAGGFLVVGLAFDLELVDRRPGPLSRSAAEIGLYDRAGQQLARVVADPLVFDEVTEADVTFGAFPDGLSYALPPGDPYSADLFRGALAPTPGRPNKLGLEVAVVNELYTEGGAGWAEVAVLGARVETVAVMDGADGYGQAVPATGMPLAVADEAPGPFDLSQTGGTVYVVARYVEPRVQPRAPACDRCPIETVVQTRVVDVRRYGGQTPGRSVGFFPDAATGAWTTNLLPTRGAPNAQARRSM